MIRFSCPGCSATFNVSDDKAGKTGKCPKCSTQFMIPTLAEAAAAAGTAEAAAAPSTPAASESSGVEITPCPNCGARLTVEPGDVGLDVECPTCQTVYPAEAAAPAPRKAPGSGVKKSLATLDEDDEERPSRRSSRRAQADDEDDDDRPSRRVSKRNDDEELDRPVRKKKKKSKRSDQESKRMVAGLLAIFLGAYGVHKFYLGYTTAGIIQLVVSCVTCGFGGFIPFIEGIIYFTKSDEDFVEIYQVGQKEWF